MTIEFEKGALSDADNTITNDTLDILQWSVSPTNPILWGIGSIISIIFMSLSNLFVYFHCQADYKHSILTVQTSPCSMMPLPLHCDVSTLFNLG